ncbi:MAG: fluoride efflux transporter CrcB [Pseudonocardiales bacterium]|nr:MAG: fluoride efflux transporter CrcB [Pseudonocardiales bacterium]
MTGQATANNVSPQTAAKVASPQATVLNRYRGQRGQRRRVDSAGVVPSPGRRELAAVFVGGAIGTVCRGLLGEAYPAAAVSWPWVTFAVNLVGAFLLGYFATRLQERLPLSSYRRPLLGTGLCGGLTTFSTMQVELLTMIDTRHVGLAVGYAAASVVGGYAAIHLATALVRRVRVWA